jgi:hypothetical protein
MTPKKKQHNVWASHLAKYLQMIAVCEVCLRRPAVDIAHRLKRRLIGWRTRSDMLEYYCAARLCRECHTFLDEGETEEAHERMFKTISVAIAHRDWQPVMLMTGTDLAGELVDHMYRTPWDPVRIYNYRRESDGKNSEDDDDSGDVPGSGVVRQRLRAPYDGRPARDDGGAPGQPLRRAFHIGADSSMEGGRMDEEIELSDGAYRRTSVKTKDRSKIDAKVAEFESRGETVHVQWAGDYGYIYIRKEKPLQEAYGRKEGVSVGTFAAQTPVEQGGGGEPGPGGVRAVPSDAGRGRRERWPVGVPGDGGHLAGVDEDGVRPGPEQGAITGPIGQEAMDLFKRMEDLVKQAAAVIEIYETALQIYADQPERSGHELAGSGRGPGPAKVALEGARKILRAKL